MGDSREALQGHGLVYMSPQIETGNSVKIGAFNGIRFRVMSKYMPALGMWVRKSGNAFSGLVAGRLCVPCRQRQMLLEDVGREEPLVVLQH